MIVNSRKTAAAVAASLVFGTLTAVTAAGSDASPVSPKTNPCKLVPVGSASTILHAHVTEIDAPLGPTCIFKLRGRKQTYTLAIEAISVSATVRKMKHVSKFKLTGHSAYCGRLGTDVLLVALPHRQALDVHAPCRAARGLASVALPHIEK